MLSAIRFRNYLPFLDWAELELRPLTLLFGYNNVGKSAASRLLPSIANTMVNPQHFYGGMLSGSGHFGSPEFEFELKWSDAEIARAHWTMRSEDSRVNSLVVETRAGDITSESPQLTRQMEDLIAGVRWISSHYGEATRAVSALQRPNPALWESVNTILEALSSPWPDLRIVRGPHGKLRMKAHSTLRLGETLAHMLPIAVALGQIAINDPDAPSILCVEHPEKGLHSRSEMALSEQLVSSVRPNRRVLIETHSRSMMLAVQVALAEGRITPDQVRVYWVDQHPSGRSFMHKVELDELGRGSNWPPNLHREEADMARRLIQARLKR